MEANALSSGTIQIESLRKCGRRQVVQTGLRALPVVKHFDVLADSESGLLACSESPMVDQLALQRTPERFDRGVIVAVAAAAHRRAHAELPDDFLVSRRTILRAAIGMLNQAGVRTSVRDGAKQRRAYIERQRDPVA